MYGTSFQVNVIQLLSEYPVTITIPSKTLSITSLKDIIATKLEVSAHNMVLLLPLNSLAYVSHVCLKEGCTILVDYQYNIAPDSQTSTDPSLCNRILHLKVKYERKTKVHKFPLSTPVTQMKNSILQEYKLPDAVLINPYVGKKWNDLTTEFKNLKIFWILMTPKAKTTQDSEHPFKVKVSIRDKTNTVDDYQMFLPTLKFPLYDLKLEISTIFKQPFYNQVLCTRHWGKYKRIEINEAKYVNKVISPNGTIHVFLDPNDSKLPPTPPKEITLKFNFYYKGVIVTEKMWTNSKLSDLQKYCDDFMGRRVYIYYHGRDLTDMDGKQTLEYYNVVEDMEEIFVSISGRIKAHIFP